MNPVDPLQFFIFCRTGVHLNNPHTSNVQIHRILCWFAARLRADFSRTAARAHSTLRCTAASPHGPLRMAYLLFGSPWASCSHLVLSHSSQFASFFFVHLPLRLRLTPRITQRVPILFQHKSARCQSLPDYLLQTHESLLQFYYFLYITNTLTSSFILSTDCLSRVIKRDEPKGSPPLAYFISDPSIVLSVCVPVFKEPHSTLFHTSSTKNSSVFNQSRRSRIISVVPLFPLDLCATTSAFSFALPIFLFIASFVVVLALLDTSTTRSSR